jgi:Fur family transcriptional regulator, peroxide stress response regulator
MESGHNQDILNQKLSDSGLRSTRQREWVYAVLMAERDHPTAEEIFARVKVAMPTISLATVYNCLEALIQCGLIRPVNFEREPTRYCPNLNDHAHFHDTLTGEIRDVELPPELFEQLKALLPPDVAAASIELNFRGSSRARVSNAC